MSRKPASVDQVLQSQLASFPSSQSPLFGREREVSLSAALLQRADIRLLTLTGPGGIGKTRLGIAVATRMAPRFDMGTRFVSLAGVPLAGLVPTAIAHAFNVAETSDASMLGGVINALHDAEILIVLDNFEHVVSAAPLISELLGSCPRIKVLVTSRAPLRITGEHTVPVPPLALPSHADEATVDQLASSPAVQLFVDRAQAVDPSFTLTEANASAVGALCVHLDGLPLAIELAAAQSGILPPAALLSRIDAGMSLPYQGPRDAPTRLRTMHNAISWSYELLPPEEQQLFRCTGVFVGGFGLEAAEAVCRASFASPNEADEAASPATSSFPRTQTGGSDILNGLASLVDSSLVQQAAWEGEARFSLLETIRGFAQEQLFEHGEYERFAAAHAAWYEALAEENRWAWLLPGGERRLMLLEIEHPNILAALQWLHQRGENERLLRMSTVLGGFWYSHTHYREGCIWLEKALAAETSAPPVPRAQASVALGMLLNLQGHTSRAEELLADGLTTLKEAGEGATVALILVALGALANFRGEYERAETLLTEALSVQESIPNVSLAASIQGRALSNLGVAAQGRGDLDLAMAQHERALQLYREHGYILGVIRSLCDRGEIASDMGDFAGSLKNFQESLSLLGGRGDLRVVIDALEGAALAAAAWNEPERAAGLLGAASAVKDQIGSSATIEADRLARERAMSAIRALLDDDDVQAALSAGRKLSLPDAIAEVQAMSPPGTSAAGVDPTRVRLSAREEEVLRMLVAGYSDRAIAEELYLSVRTVEAHVNRIRIKLGVRSRTAAVTTAIVSGLIDPNPPAGD